MLVASISMALLTAGTDSGESINVDKRSLLLTQKVKQVHLTAPRDTAREAEEPAEILLRPLQMEEQVNPLERDHVLAVVLPGGLEKNATVHGSKPVMDVLVTLCASYHLNPSDYIVEVLSANKNNINFKPNSPIGSLEAEKIVLKPKGMEERIRRPPYMPEASVRLLINYNKANKTVVRVSPTVPLEMLLPVICDKCEFGVQTTVLLRDPGTDQLLDTSRTLNELGLRELFAKDTEAREPVDLDPNTGTTEAAVTPAKVVLPPPEELPKVERKPKKNTGFLSLFRKGKKSEMEGALSAPVSPSLGKQVGAATNGQGTFCSSGPADMPMKKRRAPQPPVAASQSVPTDLGTCHLRGPQGSAESTLRSTKRRAPPPPPANLKREMQTSSEAESTAKPCDSLSTLEENRESDECASIKLTPSPPRSPPEPRHRRFSSSSTLSSLHGLVDPYLPSFGGKDMSDARSALAKVLTSSVSRGALLRRLKNSAAVPKSSSGSTMTPGARGCFDDGGIWAQPESVPLSSLPSQPEWEEPVHRVAMTTFKVVPSKSTGSEPAPVVLDHTEVEDEPVIGGGPDPETERQTQPEDDPQSQSRPEVGSQEDPASHRPPSLPPSPDSESHVCPDSPPTEEEEEEDNPEVAPEATPAETSECHDVEALTEGQTDSAEQKEVAQSPEVSGSTDVDLGGPHAEETDDEEVQQDEAVDEAVEEDAFPPPPSPVFFTEDTNILDEVEEVAHSSCLPPYSQPSSPTFTGPGGALCEDLQMAPQLPERGPEASEKTDVAPSRFAEAVAMAVQKSRLQRQGKVLGPRTSSGPAGA